MLPFAIALTLPKRKSALRNLMQVPGFGLPGYEYMASLKMKGAPGSPGNPIAIF
jgi:hypothetical protein